MKKTIKPKKYKQQHTVGVAIKKPKYLLARKLFVGKGKFRSFSAFINYLIDKETT